MKVDCSHCGLASVGTAPQCPHCGQHDLVKLVKSQGRSIAKVSTTAKIYTGVLIAWALIFPFLVPFILEYSHTHP